MQDFHPLIADWFRGRFARPTDCQLEAWPPIRAGRDVLVSAPTGSGKTLAAFLICLDRLVVAGMDEPLDDRIDVVYVSPLKALSNDIGKNLETPLAEIESLAANRGLPAPGIRTAGSHRRHPGLGARADGAAAAAHPGHDTRIALYSADGRPESRGAQSRRHRHRG